MNEQIENTDLLISYFTCLDPANVKFACGSVKTQFLFLELNDPPGNILSIELSMYIFQMFDKMVAMAATRLHLNNLTHAFKNVLKFLKVTLSNYCK